MIGYRLAHLIGSVDRTVGLVLGLDDHGAQTVWSTLHLADLRLALTEVAPVRVAVPEAALVGLGDDPDDTHVRDLAERSIPRHGSP